MVQHYSSAWKYRTLPSHIKIMFHIQAFGQMLSGRFPPKECATKNPPIFVKFEYFSPTKKEKKCNSVKKEILVKDSIPWVCRAMFSNIGHQVEILELIENLANMWCHLHQLQIRPPSGTTCIGSTFSH